MENSASNTGVFVAGIIFEVFSLPFLRGRVQICFFLPKLSGISFFGFTKKGNFYPVVYEIVVKGLAVRLLLVLTN